MRARVPMRCAVANHMVTTASVIHAVTTAKIYMCLHALLFL